MKILHTSDWHLGRTLYGRKRHDEFEAFLDWLACVINEEKIDSLLIAGDVFDTSTPGSRAQELYYRFLHTVSLSCCRHVVVIAGNHDSPTFLEAPKALLRAFNIHVVGAVSGNPEDNVIVLDNVSGKPEMVVCAVPYLRDRDIRTVEPGESIDDKSIRLAEAVRSHYADVCCIALEQQQEAGGIPLVVMGHLFAAGGKTVDGDGVRELYVGSLAHVGTDIFPDYADYVALGHLHVPQKVGNQERTRYSGSPIPMGYGESGQNKSVVIAEFCKSGESVESVISAESFQDAKLLKSVNLHPVPCFQALERISGDLDVIIQRIADLKALQSRAWLEIEYTGKGISGNFREIIDEAVAGSDMEVRRIKNRSVTEMIINRLNADEELNDLGTEDVFIRRLDERNIEDEKRPGLLSAFREILESVHEGGTE